MAGLPKVYNGVVNRSRKKAAKRKQDKEAGLAVPREYLTVAEHPRPNRHRAGEFEQLGEKSAFVPRMIYEIERRRVLWYRRETFSPGSEAGWLDFTVGGPGGIAQLEWKGSTNSQVSWAQFDFTNQLRASHQLAFIFWPEDHHIGDVAKVLDRLAGPYIPMPVPLPPLVPGDDPARFRLDDPYRTDPPAGHADQPGCGPVVPPVRLAECGCPYGQNHNPKTCSTWNGSMALNRTRRTTRTPGPGRRSWR